MKAKTAPRFKRETDGFGAEVKCPRCRSHPRFPRSGLPRKLDDGYFCDGCGKKFEWFGTEDLLP